MVTRLLLALSCSSLAAQAVHYVDIRGISGYPDIQTAINTAADGDVISIRTGVYNAGSFIVNDKALTIVEEAGHTVSAVSAVIINPNGKDVVIKGIDFRRNSPGVSGLNPGRNLLVRDNAGQIWIEDCTFATGGTILVAAGPALPAVELQNTNAAGGSFVMTRCDVRGSDGVRARPGVMQASVGLLLRTTSIDHVALYDTAVRGGDGADGYWNTSTPGSDGGDGLVLVDGACFASGGLLAGGDGGAGSAGLRCVGGGDGGDGVVVLGAAAITSVGTGTVLGGGAGGAAAGGCSGGTSGSGAVPGSGSWALLPGAAAGMTAPASAGIGALSVV
ncbi:MAG: hypothetical protein KDC98_04030, partial [Planctomycetes bacterium]|nr:hypothetical protein [Planctomycetota bacterium]